MDWLTCIMQSLHSVQVLVHLILYVFQLRSSHTSVYECLGRFLKMTGSFCNATHLHNMGVYWFTNIQLISCYSTARHTSHNSIWILYMSYLVIERCFIILSFLVEQNSRFGEFHCIKFQRRAVHPSPRKNLSIPTKSENVSRFPCHL